MLEVKNLRKTFGDLTAVEDVSFTIRPGDIMGLIGQNGAGKTTTFRIILDLLTADEGEVLWENKRLSKKSSIKQGIFQKKEGLYPKVSIENQILYFAQLRGKKKSEISPLIDDWLKKFDVKGKKTDKVKTLSKGNQQKVQLICTLIHEPELIILDEPFSGLDPVNAELLEEGIREAQIDTPTAKAVGFLSALSNAGHFCFVQALSLRVCHHPSHGRAYSSMGTHTVTI